MKENRRKVVEIALGLELPLGLPTPEEAIARSRKILRELRGQPRASLCAAVNVFKSGAGGS